MFLIVSSDGEFSVRLENRDDGPPDLELHFIPASSGQPGQMQCWIHDRGGTPSAIRIGLAGQQTARCRRESDEWALWA